MNSVYSGNLTISLFGESHGPAIGAVIDGLPPGLDLDLAAIAAEMNRRKPGTSSMATPRKEEDAVDIVSGLFEGRTTGAPLCGIIFTKDTRSKDYSELKVKMRPGHSDYPGSVHYRGFNDYRGGGHFSGRLTAPLVFAGAVAREYLRKEGVEIGSHLLQVYDRKDRPFALGETRETLKALRGERVPVLDKALAGEIEAAIVAAKAEGDSLGAVVECIALGVRPGIGNPMFNSLESRISQLLFSVPGVKGVAFGAGFRFAEMKGSEANDPYEYVGDEVRMKTNNNGGILGGISAGSPVVFTTVMKPTPSISKVQETVNLETRKNDTLQVTGRHDPCIAIRGIPVIESVLAIALLDAYLEDKKWD